MSMELEKHMPHTFIHKYVDFEIRHYPKHAALRKEFIKTGRNYFDVINDEIVIRDDSEDLDGLKKWGYRIFVFYLISIIYLFIKYPGNDFISLDIILYTLLLVIPGIFIFIYYKYGPPKKQIVYNRMEGTVEIPGVFWERPYLFKFLDLHPVYSIGNPAASVPYVSVLRYRTRAKFFKIRGGVWMNITKLSDPHESWSYWVWYMDKNRPLPPGTAFDEFRLKDFERRKAEGFPPPLYKSTIPTPEATPQQQAERDKFWKEEDYIVPEPVLSKWDAFFNS